MDEFQQVTVDVKVIYIGDPTEVSVGKIKQDITVADCTDNSHLTIWKDKMNMLDKDVSYASKNTWSAISETRNTCPFLTVDCRL